MTRHLALLLGLLGLAALPALASAQAPAARTFDRTVTYERCAESWRFACGMRDAEGHTYGTAQPIRQCTSYELTPDGRVRRHTSMGIDDAEGRYRVEGGVVRLELFDADGGVASSEALTLSEDRSTLGSMHRVPPAPTPDPATP